jgi:hypothetical protein
MLSGSSSDQFNELKDWNKPRKSQSIRFTLNIQIRGLSETKLTTHLRILMWVCWKAAHKSTCHLYVSTIDTQMCRFVLHI